MLGTATRTRTTCTLTLASAVGQSSMYSEFVLGFQRKCRTNLSTTLFRTSRWGSQNFVTNTLFTGLVSRNRYRKRNGRRQLRNFVTWVSRSLTPRRIECRSRKHPCHICSALRDCLYSKEREVLERLSRFQLAAIFLHSRCTPEKRIIKGRPFEVGFDCSYQRADGMTLAGGPASDLEFWVPRP